MYWLCALTSMLTIYVNFPITITSVSPLILLLHPELSATVLSTVNGPMFSRVQQRLLVTRSPALGSNFFPRLKSIPTLWMHPYPMVFLAPFITSPCFILACVASVSVYFRSKKKTGNGIFGFDRARNETRAIFRAVFDSCSSFFALKPHRNACYAC